MDIPKSRSSSPTSSSPEKPRRAVTGTILGPPSQVATSQSKRPLPITVPGKQTQPPISSQIPSSKDGIDRPSPKSWAATTITGISKKTSGEMGQKSTLGNSLISPHTHSAPISSSASKFSTSAVLPSPSATGQSSLAQRMKAISVNATKNTNIQDSSPLSQVSTSTGGDNASHPKISLLSKSAWTKKSSKILSATTDPDASGPSALSSGPKKLSAHPRAHEKRIVSHEPGRIANGKFIAKDNLRWDATGQSYLQHKESHSEIKDAKVREGYIKLAKNEVTENNPATRIQTSHTDLFNPRESRTAGDAVMSGLYPEGHSTALAEKPVVVVVNSAGSEVVTGYPLTGKSGINAAREKIEKEVDADNKRLEKQKKGS